MSNIQIGETVFIRNKDCKLVKKPLANDASYGFLTLQPGTPVIWLGEALENKGFHKIQYQGQIGYTLLQNLSHKQFADFDLGACINCKGTGQTSVRWGNSQGFIVCQLCNGKGSIGKPLSSQAYPTPSWEATKG